MKATHRCTQTGETVRLEPRYCDDAQWYITYHDCDSVPCVNYHEPETIEE